MVESCQRRKSGMVARSATDAGITPGDGLECAVGAEHAGSQVQLSGQTVPGGLEPLEPRIERRIVRSPRSPRNRGRSRSGTASPRFTAARISPPRRSA